MDWCTPVVEEIKMDAEIGSYNEDREDQEWSPILRLANVPPEVTAGAVDA